MLEVDPEARNLEPVLTGPGEKLSKAVADKTAAQRAVNRASAMRDYTYTQMGKSIDAYERKASSEFEKGEDDAGYQRLFPSTPAQLARTPIDDRPKLYGDFVSEAQSEETPKALDKSVKSVVSGWAAYQAAVKRLDTAQAQLGKARDKLEAAKAGIIVALRKLEGQLTDRFADDTKRVRGYFAPTKAARKAVKKPGDSGGDETASDEEKTDAPKKNGAEKSKKNGAETKPAAPPS